MLYKYNAHKYNINIMLKYCNCLCYKLDADQICKEESLISSISNNTVEDFRKCNTEI